MARAKVYQPPPDKAPSIADVLAYLRRIPGDWRSTGQLCKHFKMQPTNVNRGDLACDALRLVETGKLEHRSAMADYGPTNEFRAPPPPVDKNGGSHG